MLNRVSKMMFLGIFLSICLFSCKNKKENKKEKQEEMGELYEKVSVNVATKLVYQEVYKNANDSMNCWVKNSLARYTYCRLNSWKFDSLICFNKAVDKCVMALCYINDYNKSSSSDHLVFFYGAKIMERWYFFSGASIVLPREYYQKDTHIPLTFMKLHEIAMKEVFRGYLKKDLRGKWEINEDFFSDMTSKAYCSTCHTEEEFEKIWLAIVAENWNRRNSSGSK